MPRSNLIPSLAAILFLVACAGNPSPAAAPGVTPVPQESQPSVSEGAAAPAPEMPSDARIHIAGTLLIVIGTGCLLRD
jgi:hypothetical protein